MFIPYTIHYNTVRRNTPQQWCESPIAVTGSIKIQTAGAKPQITQQIESKSELRAGNCGVAQDVFDTDLTVVKANSGFLGQSSFAFEYYKLCTVLCKGLEPCPMFVKTSFKKP